MDLPLVSADGLGYHVQKIEHIKLYQQYEKYRKDIDNNSTNIVCFILYWYLKIQYYVHKISVSADIHDFGKRLIRFRFMFEIQFKWSYYIYGHSTPNYVFYFFKFFLYFKELSL